MDLRLVLYRGDEYLDVLAGATNIRWACPWNDASTLSFSLPRFVTVDGEIVRNSYQGVGDPLAIMNGCDVAVEVNWGNGWAEPRNARHAVLVEKSSNLTETDTLDFECLNAVWYDLSACLNLDAKDLNEDGKRVFRNRTPGSYMETFIREAQAEGIGSLIDESFSSSGDTEGIVWPKVVTLELSPDISGQQVLASLTDQNLTDWWTQGNELVLAVPSTTQRQLSTVDVQLGREIEATPSTRDRTELLHEVLVVGENGLKARRSVIADVPPRGRRAAVNAQGGVSEPATAIILADAQLARARVIKQQYTRDLIFDFPDDAQKNAARMPFQHYRPGDWINAPGQSGKVELMVVQQITLTVDENGVGGNLVMNDRILDAEVRRTRRVNGIIGGSTRGGGSGASPSPTSPVAAAPGKVTGITTESTAYLTWEQPDNPRDTGQEWRAATTIRWLEPAHSTSIVYDVEYTRPGQWWHWFFNGVSGEQVTAGNLLTETEYRVRVRARNSGEGGLAGAWSDWAYFTTIRDTEPPSQPTPPELVSDLGVVYVTWDKLMVDGPPPADLAYVRVDQVTGTTAAEVARVYLEAATVVLGPFDRATPLEYRFVAVDTSDNESIPSESRSIAVKSVMDDPQIAAWREEAAQDLVDLSDRLDNLNVNDLPGLQAELDDLRDQLLAADTAITNDTIARLAALKGELEAADQAVREDLADQIAALNADTLPGLQADLTALDTKINDNKTALEAADTAVRNDLTGALNTTRTALEAADAQARSDLLAADLARLTEAKNYADSVVATGGGNKNTYSTSTKPENTTGYKAGDRWFRYTTPDRTIIEQWVVQGTTWVAETVTNAVIANLDAGKITTGTLDAARIAAQSITSDKLVVGGSGNMFEDPRFISSVNMNQRVVSGTAAKLIDDQGFSRAQLFGSGARFNFLASGAFAGYQVSGGQKYRAQISYRTAATDTSDTVSIRAYFDDKAGAYLTVTTSGLRRDSGGDLTFEWEVPAGAWRMRVYVQLGSVDPNGNTHFWNPVLYQLGTSTTIADGAITTNKIVVGAVGADQLGANAVTAAKLASNAVTTDALANGSVTTVTIADGAILAGKIGANQVVAGKIAADAVTANTIAANAVTTAKINAGAVTANEIATNAITTDKVNANAITTAKIATNAITANELAANSVLAGNIVAGAVTTAKIAAGAVTANEIAARSITGDKLAIGSTETMIPNSMLEYKTLTGWPSGAVLTTFGSAHPGGFTYGASFPASAGTYSLLGLGEAAVIPGERVVLEVWLDANKAGSVMTLEVVDQTGARVSGWTGDLSSSGSHPIFGEVPPTWQEFTATVTIPATVNKLRLGTLVVNSESGSVQDAVQVIAGLRMRRQTGSTLIENGAITTDKIFANAVTTNKIATNAVTTNELAANAVTANNIAAGAITTEKLVVGSVGEGQLANSSVSSVILRDGAVIADKIAASAVRADHIQSGAITTAKLQATAIDGMTITGATVRTSSSGSRVQMTSSGLQAYNGSTQTVNISGTNGAVTIGTAGARLQFTPGSLSVEGIIRSNQGGQIPRVEINNALWSQGLTGIRFYTRSGSAPQSEIWSNTTGSMYLTSGAGSGAVGNVAQLGLYKGSSQWHVTNSSGTITSQISLDNSGGVAISGANSTLNLNSDGVAILGANGRLNLKDLPGGGNFPLAVDSNWRVYYQGSMRELKTNIENADVGEAILQIQPRRFNWKNDPDNPNYDSGVVVEEVEEIIADHPQLAPLVRKAPGEGNNRVFAYDKVGVHLIPTIRRLAERVTQLETQLEEA